MALKTEETFRLRAPADRVWAYLIDPRNVVKCLPGAELTSVESETAFLGKVKVKVGPITAAYSGKVVITERDDAARVVRMTGEGKEGGGGGSAKVAITSTVVELAAGMSEVRVTADLDIVGKIAQFGRGMIESVNKQMFRQFTECVRATLESEPAAPAPPSAPLASAPTTEAKPEEPRPSPVAAPADNTRVDTAPVAPQMTPTVQPVRLMPLLGRAVWELVVSLVRRVFGRRPA